MTTPLVDTTESIGFTRSPTEEDIVVRSYRDLIEVERPEIGSPSEFGTRRPEIGSFRFDLEDFQERRDQES